MNEIKKSGIVNKIIFTSENGYNIFSVLFDNELEEEVCVGFCQIKEANRYEFSGLYIEHDKYGQQLKVKEAKQEQMTEGHEIVTFLSSDNFQGIGKFTAEKIYNYFQEQTLDILKNNPERIDELSVSDKIKEELKNKFDQVDGIEELYKLLVPLGFSNFIIEELYKTLYQMNIEKKVSYILANPFDLIKDTYGFKFADADQIFLNNNGNIDDEVRIEAAIEYFIQELCYRSGDTLVEKELLTEEFNKKFSDINLKRALELAISKKIIIEVDGSYMHKDFYKEEIDIARNLKLRRKFFDNDQLENHFLDTEISLIADELKINYSSLQSSAIKMSLENRLSIITGGPGTGKTTIIQGICKLYEKYFLKNNNEDISNKIILCAPTGRAAQRMKEATGYSAKTIHSLLEWDPYTNKFNRDLEDQLIHELVIIDEFSMVDIFLANALFKAIRPTSIIVIVGDPAQLESVNPGNVLADLLSDKQIKRTNLSEIFRQGDGSYIAKLAKNINENLEISLEKTQDMSIIEKNGAMIESIAQIVDKSYAANYSENEVQVLYPMYSGETGIDKLNIRLQPERTNQTIKILTGEFQVGDKIMVLKNNYEKDIYNGDIGYIERVHKTNPKNKEIAVSINIRGKLVDLTKNEMLELKHAYAISIHKSQGSEFSVVILPITRAATKMHTKKLLYTAITRAKDKLIIIGEIDYFIKGIYEQDRIRKTALKIFLKKDLNIK